METDAEPEAMNKVALAFVLQLALTFSRVGISNKLRPELELPIPSKHSTAVYLPLYARSSVSGVNLQALENCKAHKATIAKSTELEKRIADN